MDAETTSDISDMTKVDVSVIIVNWNTCDLLRDCLQSIVDQTSASCEMIVVDNASADASAQMVRDEFPQAVLIANSENNGFAAANNQGLAVARGAHVLLLNPDTIILDGAIDKMLDWLGRHPDVGCVGCQVLEGPDVIQRTCFAEPGFLNLAIVDFGLMRLGDLVPLFARPWYTNWDRKSERDVDVVSGMFMLVPRHVLEKVGPLDDAFFVYSEEADWCYRIRQAGWRCVFSPEAQIIHLDGGSKSTSQIRSRMHVQMQKSHLIYARKHHGQAGFIGAKLINILSAMLRLTVFGAMRLFRSDPETKAKVRLSLASLRYLILGKEPVS
ncbi:glycosyltransferase family 2 protein [Aliiroseovarius sp. 2305UL8-7]|uniref:glycosyltransferase family 2 protein n=1 Tax=Aliiroseovarius conchicola TaxID=3121637 RepID=UPI00352760DC